MSSPGDRRTERATVWAARREGAGVVEMYLETHERRVKHFQILRTHMFKANARSTSVTITEPRWK